MRYSPRIRSTNIYGKHPENGPPPKRASDAEAYQHEVDRIAVAVVSQRRQLTVHLGYSPRLRSVARSMADRLIDHEGDDVGRDDGLAATALAYGTVCDDCLAEWRNDIERAVVEGVGPTTLEDSASKHNPQKVSAAARSGFNQMSASREL